MCSIGTQVWHRNIDILNIHAPSEDRDKNLKTAFYEQPEKVLTKVMKKDVKMILGDCSAKIRKEQINEPVIGKHCLPLNTNKIVKTNLRRYKIKRLWELFWPIKV